MVASITPSPPSMCKKQKGVPGILSFFHRNIYFSIVLYWGDISYFVRSYWRGKGNICTFIYSTWQLSNKDVRTRELRWKHSWFLCLDCLNCASTHKFSLYFIFLFEDQPVYHEALDWFIFLLFLVDQCTHDCFFFFLIIYYNQNHCLFFPAWLNEWFLEVFLKNKKKNLVELHQNAYISNVYFKVCAVAGQ